MENVTISISDDDILTLTVDLKLVSGFTRERKNVRIASSLGNIQLPGKDGNLRVERFNVNVFRPLNPRERHEDGIHLKGWGMGETEDE
ncbi:MAG: hypothetical protein V1792_07280 [Pseudomonadota bacterium]